MTQVLIIEDELPAALRLSKLIKEIAPEFEIVQICDSIETSVLFLKNQKKTDLIFADIQLGDGLSFEIFKQVKILCPVIFTTAFDEYVFRAFELNSIDYLLKPIHKEQLAKSIEKFKLLSNPLSTDWQFLSTLIEKDKTEHKQRFLVNSGTNLISVKTSDVAYFYSVGRATFMSTTSGKNYDVDYSLDRLETMLPSSDFFRINRQFLITANSLKKIHVLSKSRMKIILEPNFNEEIFVSNARAHEFRVWLDK